MKTSSFVKQVWKGKLTYHSLIGRHKEQIVSELPEGTVILDFQPPHLWDNKFLFVKPLSFLYINAAALENWYKVGG